MRNPQTFKLASILGLAALLLCAAPLAAQDPANPFAGQAELAASDIPTVIEILETAKANPTDPNALMAVYAKHGIDPMRGAYLLARASTGIGIISSGTTLEAAATTNGAANVPSEAEFAVIKENEASLKAAMGQPAQ
ncbi:MAG: hypothetical protein LBT40_08105 [Deltaproteobacteria bacterium]|jgi:hypothetical protein|nr:hypothetical protein [Deltaproteobacteria bacterium]